MIPITVLTVSACLLHSSHPRPVSLSSSHYAYNVCCVLLWSVRLFSCQLGKQDFEI